LSGVSLLNCLQCLTFVGTFNQRLHGVILPNRLKLLKFGVKFPPELLSGVMVPSNLESLTDRSSKPESGWCFECLDACGV
jgi:hypothetical protein